jgi:hypothetical protein
VGVADLADEYLAAIDVHGGLDVREAVRAQAEGRLEQSRTGWQLEAARSIGFIERLQRTTELAKAVLKRRPQRRLDAHRDPDALTHRPTLH